MIPVQNSGGTLEYEYWTETIAIPQDGTKTHNFPLSNPAVAAAILGEANFFPNQSVLGGIFAYRNGGQGSVKVDYSISGVSAYFLSAQLNASGDTLIVSGGTAIDFGGSRPLTVYCYGEKA